MKKLTGCMFLFFNLFLLKAQSDSATYNAHDFFLESFNPPAGNVYRSANGTPGPKYWQNQASYLIHATLNEADTSVSGEVAISYTNNSPDSLRYLWLQLDQNIFDPASRGVAASPPTGDPLGVRGVPGGGYQISAVRISFGNKTVAVQPIITDTRMQIRLATPLPSGGGHITIQMKFRFFIPANGAGRMGRLYANHAVVYTIGQWFPRMCVYDDVEGWNTLPYMGQGEFYCDYGNYDYYITAPAAMIVYGSGELQNPRQVLTPREISRLASAASSDKTIYILSPTEAGSAESRPVSAPQLTWHYTMNHTRDVAWAASRALVWDAARVNLPSGRKAIAMSAYPVESVGDSTWSRATEYLKHSMEIYSKNYFEYPWNVAINIGSSVTGMEYPGMIFNDYMDRKASLWFVIAHEIGHNWFPMIVGSNERKYMWQDEGFNSYINYQANDVFNQGEYAKDTTLFSRNHFAYLDISTLPLLKDPLMTVSEAMDIDQHHQYYSKTAYGLKMLRDVVVGKDRFDYAFRTYTAAWAFKHPTPYDFFHCINNAAGEDLNWFWKEWFFTTWTLDQAVADVRYNDQDPSNGARITIVNKSRMILPVILKIVQRGGKTDVLRLPVEIWQRGDTWTIPYSSKTAIDSVILDPEHVLPDIDRENNLWHGKK